MSDDLIIESAAFDLSGKAQQSTELNQQQEFDLFIEELNYSYENVPFYRKHFDRNSELMISDIQSGEDVALVPVTKKHDYRKNFPLGVFAKGYQIKDERLTRSQSSGTTGERLVTFELGMLLMGRAMNCAEINPQVGEAFIKKPRKICRYAAPNCSDVECANPNSSMADRTLEDGTLVLPVYHDLLTTSTTLIDRAIEEIFAYQPDLYYVDATHFAFLMREFKKRGLTPPKAPIIASYTGVSELNRHQIMAQFNHDVVFSELYSCSEMGWLALECEHNHLHLNHSSYFFEIVDDNDQSVQIGETGQLVISSIDHGAIPHIRYKTGDLLKWVGGSCECGHQGAIVQMMGREGHCLTTKEGEKIPFSIMQKSFGVPKGVDMYQLHQHSLEQFTLRLVVNQQFDDQVQQQLLTNLHQLLGEQVTITVEAGQYIATERSGKFQCLKTDL